MSGTAANIQINTSTGQGKLDQFLYQPLALKNRIQKLCMEHGCSFQNNELQGDKAKVTSIRNYILNSVKDKFSYAFLDKFKPCIPCANAYIQNLHNIRTLHPTQPSTVDITVNVDSSAVYINDQFLVIETEAPTSTGNPTARFRYCEKPGIRIIRSVELFMNNQLVTSYKRPDVVAYDKINVYENARHKWNSCIGQDNGLHANIYNEDFQFIITKNVKIGYQTYRSDQQGLVLHIPLLFWYNTCVGSSLQVSNLDRQAIRLRFTLAPQSEIVEGMVFSDDGDFTVPVDPLRIKKFSLYTNNIYVTDDTHQLLVERDFATLMRIRQSEHVILTERLFDEHIKFARWALEYLLVMAQPRTNAEISNANNFDIWDDFGRTDQICLPDVVVHNDPNGVADQVVIRTLTAYTHDKLFQNFYLKSQEEKITPEEWLPEAMGDYMPYKYSQNVQGGLATGKDTDGICLYSWSHKPGNLSLNSTLNFSKNREVRMQGSIVSDVDPDTHPVLVYICSYAVNIFLNEAGRGVRFIAS